MINREKLHREVAFHFSFASGRGGEKVNRTASKVELRWNPLQSKCIPLAMAKRFKLKFANRHSKEGVFFLVSQKHREQFANVKDVFERFTDMLEKVEQPPRKRIPSTPPFRSIEDRLKDKKIHSETKRNRKKVISN